MSHDSLDRHESLIMADWTPEWMRRIENAPDVPEIPEEIKETLRDEGPPDYTEAMRDVEAAHAGIFDEGIEKAHARIETLREKYRNSRDADAEERRFEAEYKKFGPDAAEALARERMDRGLMTHFEYPAPVWQQTSGLFPQWEKRMNPNERAGRIFNLLRTVERMIRFEMKREQHPSPRTRCARVGPLPQGERGTDGDASDEERSVVTQSYLWDPLRAVCFKLEISVAQLSRYSKETTGMSAVELVDCIRMQRARKEMKRELGEFIRTLRTQKNNNTPSAVARAANGRLPVAHNEGAPSRENGGLKNENCKVKISNCDEMNADAIWEELKKLRRAPRWHRTSWAAALGFSSYGKFFRASLLVCGATPHELEMALIDEILVEISEAEVEPTGTGESPPPVEAEGIVGGEVEEVKRE